MEEVYMWNFNTIELLNRVRRTQPGIPIGFHTLADGEQANELDEKTKEAFYRERYDEFKKAAEVYQIKIKQIDGLDYYFYRCPSEKYVYKKFDDVFVQYVQKFNLDPMLYVETLDVGLVCKRKIIKAMESAIANNDPELVGIYESVWEKIKF